MDSQSSIRAWQEGTVNRGREHFELRYEPLAASEGSPPFAVALIGPPTGDIVDVEFLVDQANPQWQQAEADVRREIDFYLVEKGETDAWAYARYHCGTQANFYSKVRWGYFMADLDMRIRDFSVALEQFPGFGRLSFSVGELRADSNWPWGYTHGVYCFVDDDQVVYVGRALGCTVGERLANQLGSTEDPEWAKVVTASDNRVELLTVDSEWAFVAAALEVYLISHLEPRPRFNKHIE